MFAALRQPQLPDLRHRLLRLQHRHLDAAGRPGLAGAGAVRRVGVAIGITTGLQFLPMLLLSAYGGLIADRFDKRRILKITQSWLALCATALGLLAITGVATTDARLPARASLFGLGTAFDNPARQTFVSEVAGPDHLPNAIGLNSATFHAARIVGPAVAGLVIAAFGSGWAILTNSLTYAAFIAALRAASTRSG